MTEQGSLTDQLEPGALRDELLDPERRARQQAAEAQRAAEEAALAAREYRRRLQFTGDGAEYFRIWIVNLLLTLLTLGVYSAWAKVRKARYFWQNTRLDGAVFDYHGAPGAILRGRLLALVLFVAYTWAFKFSKAAGLTMIGVLLLAGPWLFMRAQQFKFRNTSYRGLRFGFDGNLWLAYRALLPLLLIWFSGAVGSLFALEGWWLIVPAVATGLLFPWMHHQLKQYQHAHVSYGNQLASFRSAVGDFYSVYLKSILVLLGVGLLNGTVIAVFTGFALAVAEQQADPTYGSIIIGIGTGLSLAITYLMLWPYYAARLQKIVWERTRLGAVRFVNHLEAGPMFGLVLRTILLSLLTVGLYWPYAAVRLARYRVEAVEVCSELPFDEVATALQGMRIGATGEGAADLFGLDIGL